jgi:hypothetical protein
MLKSRKMKARPSRYDRAPDLKPVQEVQRAAAAESRSIYSVQSAVRKKAALEPERRLQAVRDVAVENYLVRMAALAAQPDEPSAVFEAYQVLVAQMATA